MNCILALLLLGYKETNNVSTTAGQQIINSRLEELLQDLLYLSASTCEEIVTLQKYHSLNTVSDFCRYYECIQVVMPDGALYLECHLQTADCEPLMVNNNVFLLSAEAHKNEIRVLIFLMDKLGVCALYRDWSIECLVGSEKVATDSIMYSELKQGIIFTLKISVTPEVEQDGTQLTLILEKDTSVNNTITSAFK